MYHSFNFGKWDANGNGIKDNLIVVDVKWNEGRLSICGKAWNRLETDTISGGQILDDLQWYMNGGNDTFKKLYVFWKLYHMNDCIPGSPRQEAYLKTVKHKLTYDQACDELLAVNLLIDYSFNNKGTNGYRYGTAWLKNIIPPDVFQELITLIEEDKGITEVKPPRTCKGAMAYDGANKAASEARDRIQAKHNLS